MAETLFGLAQNERPPDPAISQNIRKYVDAKTLSSFTREGRTQIAQLEEELFELHCRHRSILEQESELIFLLHDLILQEKYIQLNAEKRELASIEEEDKTKAQISREKLITQGLNAIMERREIMYKEAEERRLRNEEENSERMEYYEKMRKEWEAMRSCNPDFSKGWKKPVEKTEAQISNLPKRKISLCAII